MCPSSNLWGLFQNKKTKPSLQFKIFFNGNLYYLYGDLPLIQISHMYWIGQNYNHYVTFLQIIFNQIEISEPYHYIPTMIIVSE